MRVLAWQQYGNIRVYHAELPIHFMKIFDDLKGAMNGWGEDENLERLQAAMRSSSSQKICERHFVGFVCPHLGTHEVFERFEFCTVEE